MFQLGCLRDRVKIVPKTNFKTFYMYREYIISSKSVEKCQICKT